MFGEITWSLIAAMLAISLIVKDRALEVKGAAKAGPYIVLVSALVNALAEAMS